MHQHPFLEALTPPLCFNQPENKDEKSSCSVHGSQSRRCQSTYRSLFEFFQDPPLNHLQVPLFTNERSCHCKEMDENSWEGVTQILLRVLHGMLMYR